MAVAGSRAPRYAAGIGMGLATTMVVAVTAAALLGPMSAIVAKVCGIALTPVAVYMFDKRWLRKHRRKFERQAFDPLPRVHLLRS